ARRRSATRLRRQDRAHRDRAGGATNVWLRGGARCDPRREGAPRSARSRAARHGLRCAVSVLADRGRIHAVRPARRGRGAPTARVLSERLRLWLERGESGYFLRDAATGEAVRWSDPRIRVVHVAGVSYRADAL